MTVKEEIEAAFIDSQIKASKNTADRQVLGFIHEVLSINGINEDKIEDMERAFRAGLCYYFAYMLKLAFKRGEVCWAAPFGHFIWVDEDGTPYDIEGVYFGEAEEFIPEHYLGDMIKDFLHIPGVEYNATEEEIEECIAAYRKDKEKIE